MATNVYTLTITAESPLIFSQRRPGGIFLRSFDYIPGSTLRGAAAAQMLRGPHDHLREKHGMAQADCDFCHLFVGEQQAVFTDALPIRNEGERPSILPATAVGCKNNPGFLADDNGHGVFDTLVDRYCWESLAPAGLLYAPSCGCGERIDAYSTVYVWSEGGGYQKRNVAQRLLTRVAIDRRRNVAADGLLYAPWVVSEEQSGDNVPTPAPTRFSATVYGADETLKDTLSMLTAVGGRASRGLNHVKVGVAQTSLEDEAAITARIDALTQHVTKRWALFRALNNGPAQNSTYFTINLLADAVLRNPDGTPSMVIDEQMVARASQQALSAQKISLVRSYATYDYRSGWHSAWQRPKPTDVCTVRGSVFLFKVDGTLTSDEIAALTKLQRQGIGERTGEGYGHLRICDPFHLVTQDNPA